jgi:glycosyltransferase involved in cell wall biosynthesis
MTTPVVAVITPTYKRSAKVLDRCIRSVAWQSYPAIRHYVCHDGPWEEDAELDSLRKQYCLIVHYMSTPERTNTYGAGVRQYVMDNLPKEVEYIVHLDDDNVIFPDFIAEHVETLEKHPEADFSICRISHNGPLPAHLGQAPKILTGVPPVFRNIDTLQIMARAKAMKACSWTQHTGPQGYCNDGYTYQRLGEMFRWVEIPKLLAIHI